MRKTAPKRKRNALLKKKLGFTLVELLVVIAIVAILAAVVVIVVNPLELTKRSRDAARLSDLDNVQKAINIVLQEAAGANLSLCYNLTAPCSANSSDVSNNIRKVNGTGWVKVNFSAVGAITIPTLPVDPINTASYHYTYYSDGTSYELNAVLESSQYQSKMAKDGGDNDNIYEVGTNLKLLH